MPKNTKKIALSVCAALLIMVAVVFSFLLITNQGLFGEKPMDTDTDEVDEWENELINEAVQNDSPLGRVANAKFLWEYGWQAVADELPSAAPTTVKETTTVPVPETMFETLTNWKGEVVVDRNGQPVTQVREYFTDYQFELLTDENGNIARDEHGNVMTEIYEIELARTTLPPPLTMQDGHGNILTNAKGEPVTKQAKPTVYVTNPSAVGATYQGEGISDGENYIGVRVVIDGMYDVATNGIMTVGMTYKIDKKIYLKSLTYNIDKGTCRVSKDENYTGMVGFTKENGKMVVTLSIPDAAQIPVSQMRLLSASSLFGTFRDSTGTYLDGFSVNVL